MIELLRMPHSLQMRIYLVDDEEIITKTLQDFLSELGHDVVSLKSAHELLDNLVKDSQPVDLIIGDFRMPKASAVSLIREVHKRTPDIAIIIMIVNGPILSTHEAISYGVYAYLRKPIRLAELEFLLARLSEKRNNSKLSGKGTVSTGNPVAEKVPKQGMGGIP